jgi:hypothetical protein
MLNQPLMEKLLAMRWQGVTQRATGEAGASAPTPTQPQVTRPCLIFKPKRGVRAL